MSSKIDDALQQLGHDHLLVLEELYCRPHSAAYGCAGRIDSNPLKEMKEIGVYREPQGQGGRVLTDLGMSVIKEIQRKGMWPPSQHMNAQDTA